MLHMFYLYDVKVDLLLHMLQWLYTYVASIKVLNVSAVLNVCCKCVYLDVAYVALAIKVLCCKCTFQMFQLFQTYVVSVLSGCCICCSGHTHILQAYILNVSSFSDVRCNRCFMLQMFHEQAPEVGTGGVVTTGTAVPHVCGKRSGRGGPHVHAQQQAQAYPSNRRGRAGRCGSYSAWPGAPASGGSCIHMRGWATGAGVRTRRPFERPGANHDVN
jgi:hypothetical protein